MALGVLAAASYSCWMRTSPDYRLLFDRRPCRRRAPHTRLRGVAVLLLAALSLAPLAHAGKHPRLRIGDSLPALELPLLGGGRLRLKDLRGRPLAISFYSKYCVPCRKELPTLARVVERVNRRLAPRDKVMLLVIVAHGLPRGSRPPMKGADRWLLDTKAAARRAFDPRTFPCTFLIDAAAKVRNINRGFGPGYKARVQRWLQKITANPPR